MTLNVTPDGYAIGYIDGYVIGDIDGYAQAHRTATQEQWGRGPMQTTHQQKGGLTTSQKYGKQHMQEIGRRGGRSTVDRHGADHMREIGKKGAAVFYERYNLLPIDTYQYVVVEKVTGKIVAFR